LKLQVKDSSFGDNLSRKFSSLIIENCVLRPSLVFLFFSILSITLGYSAARNSFDYDLKEMTGEHQAAYENYQKCIALFGPDDDIMIGFPIEEFGEKTIVEAFEIRKLVEPVAGVSSVIDLSAAIGITSTEELKKLIASPRKVTRMIETIQKSPLFRGFIVSPDLKAHLINVRTREMPQREKQVLVQEIRHILDAKFGTGFAQLVGYPVFAERFVYLMTRDNALFIFLSLIAALLLSFFLFRSAMISAVIALAIILPGVWTQGIYAFLGYKVSLFSALLTPIIMLISLSFSIQLMARYQWSISRSSPSERGSILPLQKAIFETLPPAFLAAATTLIGFSSLILSNLRGVRAFGILSSIGCGLAFVSAYMVLPAFLYYFLGKVGHRVLFRFERIVTRALANPYFNPTVIVAAIVLASGFAMLGITRLSYGSDPVSALPTQDPVVIAHEFMNRHFGGGTRRISFVTTTASGRFDLLKPMKMLREVEAKIASDPEVLSVFSPAVLLSNIERELSGNTRSFPDSDEEVSRCLRLAGKIAPKVLEVFLNPPFFDRAHVTVALKVSDSVKVAEAARRLESIFLSAGQGEVTASATGRMLLSALIENEAIDIATFSFGSSLWLILLLIGIGLKSARAFFIAFIANAFPIFVTLGLMGWLEVPIDPSTAMAPCICIGIIVDDTIHLVHEFFRLEKPGKGIFRLRSELILKLGWPIVFNSTILTVGLGILCLSDFGPIRKFGFFSVSTVLVGLIFEIFLTPSLLLITQPRKPHLKTTD